jgi:hypothetical protein
VPVVNPEDEVEEEEEESELPGTPGPLVAGSPLVVPLVIGAAPLERPLEAFEAFESTLADPKGELHYNVAFYPSVPVVNPEDEVEEEEEESELYPASRRRSDIHRSPSHEQSRRH